MGNYFALDGFVVFSSKVIGHVNPFCKLKASLRFRTCSAGFFETELWCVCNKAVTRCTLENYRSPSFPPLTIPHTQSNIQLTWILTSFFTASLWDSKTKQKEIRRWISWSNLKNKTTFLRQFCRRLLSGIEDGQEIHSISQLNATV